MPFQFYCPQGHLLEGHEGQMGQQGQCPMCGAMFMFPMMGGQPAGQGMGPGQPMHGGHQMHGGPMQGMPPGMGQQPGGYPGQMPGGYPGQPMHGQHPQQGHGFPGQQGYGQPGGAYGQQGPPGFGPQGLGTGPDRFAGADAAPPEYQAAALEAPAEPRIFRILCPKGHELQTPEDMLGTQALCPYCNTQMELRYEDSVEYKKQKELEQRIQDEKTGQFWMKVSIWAAIIVGLLFVGLIVMMFMR